MSYEVITTLVLRTGVKPNVIVNRQLVMSIDLTS